MPEKGDYAMHRLIAAGTLTIDGLAKREPLSAALGTARIIIASPTTATFSMTSSAL
jgi:hypothetical protein